MPGFPPPPPSEGDFPPPPDDFPPPPPWNHVPPPPPPDDVLPPLPPPPPSGVNPAWVPPPSPPAGGAAPHVSNPIPEVPVVRQPMSRSAKLGWVTAILLLVLGYGGYLGYQHLNRYPKEKEVRDFVEKQLAIPSQKVVDVSAKPVDAGNSTPPVGVQLAFTATMEMTEALFATIPVQQFMQQQGADPMVFRKIQSILNGPNAARLREISGVSGPVTDFTGKMIVRETFSEGHRYTSSGMIKAIRQDGKWQLTLLSGPNPDKDAPAFGYRLSDLKGEILSTNQPDQLKIINDLISSASDTLQKLQKAQEQNRQEMLASQNAAQLAAQQEAQQKRAAAEAAHQQPAAGSSVNTAPAQTPAAGVAATTTINNVSVSSGTTITVSTLDTIDTSSSLQPFYRATTTTDINLSDGTTIPTGSDAKLIVFANGANYQMRLDSLTANGINILLNTDVFNIGTVGQGSSTVKIGFGGLSFSTGSLFKSSRIKPGKQFTFHQQ
jgi:hypothetical protein